MGGLTASGAPGTLHVFDVFAFNAVGSSTSAPVAVELATATPPTPSYVAPVIPSFPSSYPVVPVAEDQYENAFRIHVPPGITPGTVPITRITMQAIRRDGTTNVLDGTPCVIDTTLPDAPTSCIVRNLTPGSTIDRRFRVTVENALSGSAVSRTTSTNFRLADGLPVAPDDPPLPPPPGLPVVPPVVSIPIVELDLAADVSTRVQIPGYIATPQSPVSVNNPLGHPVRLNGGILAARIDAVDGRVTAPACTSPPPPQPAGINCVDLGFESEAVQKRLRIVSSVSAGLERSVAVVQINENGAYSVNTWEVQ
jgi:hypothetical protein